MISARIADGNMTYYYQLQAFAKAVQAHLHQSSSSRSPSSSSATPSNSATTAAAHDDQKHVETDASASALSPTSYPTSLHTDGKPILGTEYCPTHAFEAIKNMKIIGNPHIKCITSLRTIFIYIH